MVHIIQNQRLGGLGVMEYVNSSDVYTFLILCYSHIYFLIMRSTNLRKVKRLIQLLVKQLIGFQGEFMTGYFDAVM